jgi:hypothetical protein
MVRAFALATLLALGTALWPRPTHAQADQALCQSLLNDRVRPLLDAAEQLSPETIGAMGALPLATPLAATAYPGPWGPGYPPMQPGGWGYRPNLPWPATPRPLNAATTPALLVQGGAINPFLPQTATPTVLLGLAQQQQADASRLASIWSLQASTASLGQGWNSQWNNLALAYQVYVLASGVCGVSPPVVTGRPFLDLALQAAGFGR